MTSERVRVPGKWNARPLRPRARKMSAPTASIFAASTHSALSYGKADRVTEPFFPHAASNAAVQGHISMPLSTSYVLLVITPRFLHLTSEP
jgi:hypothetical protein